MLLCCCFVAVVEAVVVVVEKVIVNLCKHTIAHHFVFIMHLENVLSKSFSSNDENKKFLFCSNKNLQFLSNFNNKQCH